MPQIFSIILSCLLLLALAPNASAQRILHPREGLRPATMVQPVYTDADRAAGVQGDVVVGGMVQTDGTIADVTVVESSRSPTLDETTMASVRQWTFSPVEVPVPYQVRVEYRKDDLNSLATKTCADLNVDVAYFRQAFPERPVSDMPLKDLLVGLIMVTGPRGMTIENIRRASTAYEQTIAWCATQTNERVLERYLRLAR